MKVVMDKAIPGLGSALREARPDWEVVAMDGAAIGRDAVADAEALIVRTRTRCDASLLDGSAVRMVGTATIGTDHIDTEWCRRHGVRVVSAPGCNAPAVMQYVAAALNAAGFDPAVHTLGVVGKGHIGSLVVDLYRRAGGQVLVCDPPRADAGFTDEAYISLSELIERSDAITLHVPGEKAPGGLKTAKKGGYSTFHLLNPENLGANARPGIVINASRGTVLDPSLLSGGRGGERRYVIDTWAFEEGLSSDKAPGDEAVREMVEAAYIATPHIAGYSLEGKQRATAAMLSALGVADYQSAMPVAQATDQCSQSVALVTNQYIQTVSQVTNQCSQTVSQATNRHPYSVNSDLEAVIASYDILADSAAFKASPSSFELLRNSYPLRHEA